MIDTNLTGALRLIGAFTPDLIAAGSEGRTADLVNISSIGAHLVFPGYGVYGATKAALTHLSTSLRADLSPYDVRVTNVEPGLTDTELATHLDADGQDLIAEMNDQIGALTADRHRRRRHVRGQPPPRAQPPPDHRPPDPPGLKPQDRPDRRDRAGQGRDVLGRVAVDEQEVRVGPGRIRPLRVPRPSASAAPTVAAVSAAIAGRPDCTYSASVAGRSPCGLPARSRRRTRRPVGLRRRTNGEPACCSAASLIPARAAAPGSPAVRRPTLSDPSVPQTAIPAAASPASSSSSIVTPSGVRQVQCSIPSTPASQGLTYGGQRVGVCGDREAERVGLRHGSCQFGRGELRAHRIRAGRHRSAAGHDLDDVGTFLGASPYGRAELLRARRPHRPATSSARPRW